MTRRRVVVTGLGVVSPLGCEVQQVFDAAYRGESAIALVDLSSDTGSLQVPGAIVVGEPWRWLSNVPTPTCDRLSLMALAASESALNDSGLDLARISPDRVGVSVGTSHGGATSQEAAYAEIFSRKKSRLSPFTLVKVMYNGPAAQIALRHRLAGPALTYSTTCSSSAVSIGEAMRTIRHGYADVMVAGGAEAQFTYVSLVAWQALHVLAPVNQENVAASCRPFSRDRNGTVLGEGSAFVVLEEYEHAYRRGAKMYGELAGYASTNDFTHVTQPTLAGQSHAIRLALQDASMPPISVDYINAHGTGTRLNDSTETSAIKEVFGNHSRRLSISSTKAAHGHLVGAAGALEFVLSAMTLQCQRVPPTAHLRIADPECDLDFVPNVGRTQEVTTALTSSFAVGGTAAVLVVTRAV